MNVKKMKESMHKQMQEELNVLHKIDHPNVVKYVQSYQDEKYIYIIMEYIKGQDLYNKMEAYGIFKEKEAA